MKKLEKKNTYEETLSIYQRYIKTVAGKISFEYFQDLIAEGQIGLWIAYNEWEPERGTFHQCALVQIKYSMLKFMTKNSRTIKIPNHVLYTAEYKENPIRMSSTDVTIFDDGDSTIGDTIESTDYINDYDNSNEVIRDFLKHYVDQLKAKQQDIILMRYSEDMTLKEIAQIYGTSSEAIRQQIEVALKQIRTLAGITASTQKYSRVKAEGPNSNKGPKKHK